MSERESMDAREVLSILHVWSGGDTEGRAVRDVTALALTPEQERLLADIFRASLFRTWGIETIPDEHVHIEIRACLPVEKPRG